MEPEARVLELEGGRSLSYLLWETGTSGLLTTPTTNIVYFHGWPSCAHEARLVAPPARLAGLPFSLVCFDRPGVGNSTLYPQGLSYTSVAADVTALMQSLGWERAVMVGTSGGGPYAAACAALLSPRGLVSGLVLVASMTRTCGPGSAALMKGMDWGNRAGYAAINYIPAITRVGLGVAAAAFTYAVLPLARLVLPLKATSPGCLSPASATPTAVNSMGRWKAASAMALKFGVWWNGLGLPASDRRAVRHHSREVTPVLATMVTSVFGAKGLGEGLWQDMRLTSQPWTSFSLNQIHVPTLVIQGTADIHVTVAMARSLAAAIPGAHHPELRDLTGRDKIEKRNMLAGLLHKGHDSQPPGLVLVQGEGHMALVINHMAKIIGLATQLQQIQEAKND